MVAVCRVSGIVGRQASALTKAESLDDGFPFLDSQRAVKAVFSNGGLELLEVVAEPRNLGSAVLLEPLPLVLELVCGRGFPASDVALPALFGLFAQLIVAGLPPAGLSEDVAQSVIRNIIGFVVVFFAWAYWFFFGKGSKRRGYFANGSEREFAKLMQRLRKLCPEPRWKTSGLWPKARNRPFLERHILDLPVQTGRRCTPPVVCKC